MQHKITILSPKSPNCPNNVDCPAVLDVDNDPDWVYVRGDLLDAELEAAIPKHSHEGVVRYPRELWERRGA